MGLLKAIKKRLTNQFIAVIILENSCSTKVRRIKNNDILFEEEKDFEISSKDKLSKEVIKYLQGLQEEFEHTYIILFLNSYGQGVVPSCLQSAYKKFHIDYNHVKDICIDSKYSIYASNIDIRWAEKVFEKTGLDFIFSPFLILDNLRKNELHKEGIILYMLCSVNSITIMIFEKQELLYGTFINIAKDEDLLTTDYDDEGIENDLLDDEMLDEIDLDLELEESDVIADILEDVEAKAKSVEVEENQVVKSKLFGQDLRLVKYFDASLREFYENDLYKSDFVTYVKIYDGTNLNSDIVVYLKEQLLVDIDVKNIDLKDELITLTIQEVNA